MASSRNLKTNKTILSSRREKQIWRIEDDEVASLPTGSSKRMYEILPRQQLSYFTEFILI
jgi:hypothetical protein